jgi:hypothetical protein
MLPDHRKDVVDLDVRRIHQRVDALHAYLEAAVPAQVERCPCRCCHPHAPGETDFVVGQLVAAHDHALLWVGVCADDLGRGLWGQPFRAVHGGSRHTTQRRAGGQPRRPRLERGSHVGVATDIDVAKDRSKTCA